MKFVVAPAGSAYFQLRIEMSTTALRIISVLLFIGCIYGQCYVGIANQICQWIPRNSDQSTIAYNGPTDSTATTAPWVIGQTTELRLNPGSYTPGPYAPLNLQHSIWVIESAKIIIEDFGDQEVALTSSIYLCGNAQFIVRNSTLRINSDFPFQYFHLAGGASKWILEGATIYAVKKELENNIPPIKGSFGPLIMGGSSTFTAQPGQYGYSLKVKRPFGYDYLELITTDQAITTLTAMDLFAELYISGEATLNVLDSRYFDVFIDVCKDDELTIHELPPLCDLDGSSNGVIPPCTDPLKPTMTIGPPATSFTFSMSNSSCFAFASTVNNGSTLHLGNISRYANFNLGLPIVATCGNEQCTTYIPREYHVTLRGGHPLVYQGLEETREITFTENTFVLGFQVWPQVGVTVYLDDSNIGDFNFPTDSTGIATNSSFDAQMDCRDGGVMTLLESTVSASPVLGAGCEFQAYKTVFEGYPSLQTRVAVYLSECELQRDYILDGSAAQINNMAILVPSDGQNIDTDVLDVIGSIISASNGLAPPGVMLELLDGANNVLDSKTVDLFNAEGLLGAFNISTLADGVYNVKLYYVERDFVASSKWFSIGDVASPAAGNSPVIGSPGVPDQKSPASASRVIDLVLVIYLISLVLSL